MLQIAISGLELSQKRTPGDRSMLLRPCILQHIINFPGFRRSSGRPLDAAQTVYFTEHY